MPPFLIKNLENLKNLENAYLATSFLLSLSLFVEALEDLFSFSLFTQKGLLGWTILKGNWVSSRFPRLSTVATFFFDERGTKIALYLRLFGSLILLLLSLSSITFAPLLFLLFLLKLHLGLRGSYGLDGAYHMSLLVLFALTIGSFSGLDSRIAELSLFFISGQLLLCYFISGISKIGSLVWRSGYALDAIFSTQTYGHPFLYKIIKSNRSLSLFLTWCMMLFELFFFLLLFLQPEAIVFFLLASFLFHLFNAVFMGLNDFLFAFATTYPSLIYLAWHKEKFFA